MSRSGHQVKALQFLFPLLGLLMISAGAMAEAPSPEQRRDRIERRDHRIEQRERAMERREQRLDRQEERFDDADADNDGAINREEARRSFPRLHAFFDEIDGDRSGTLAPAEIRQFWRKRARERRIERRGEDPRY